jgi:hypothetical protein
VVWAVGKGLDPEANTGLWMDCTPAGRVAGELPDASVRTYVGLILLLFGASAMGLEPSVGRREGASFLELVRGHEVRIFHSVVSTEVTEHIETATGRIRFLKFRRSKERRYQESGLEDEKKRAGQRARQPFPCILDQLQ